MAIDNKKILVVPSRNFGLRETVVRFLEKLGLTPIILATESSQGMTVIEKLENYSNVDFAVIMVSGDDRSMLNESSNIERSNRTRQNVLFELGYLVGKLGRGRVLAIYQNDADIFSDVSGVNYIRVDDTNLWKLSFANELQTLGLDINVNNLLAGDSTTDAPPPPKKKKDK